MIRKNSGTVGICYCYPASEEPYGYFSDGKPVKRYHPVKDGFSSSYTVTLRADITDGYNEAVMSSYMSYFSASDIYYFDADVGAAYDECIKTMLDYYGTKKTERMTICGLPYGCFVPTDTLNRISRWKWALSAWRSLPHISSCVTDI